MVWEASRLALRQNQNACDEFQLSRKSRQIGEHHERIVKCALFGVRAGKLGLTIMRRAKDMAIGKEMIIAHFLGGGSNAPHRLGIAPEFVLRVDDADLHRYPFLCLGDAVEWSQRRVSSSNRAKGNLAFQRMNFLRGDID